MPGLSPLQALDGVISDPEGSPDVIFGGPAQPHTAVGEETVYPWQNIPGQASNGPYGTASQLLESEPGVMVAGQPNGLINNTPITHAAPYPKGIGTGDNRNIVEAARAGDSNLHASSTNQVNPRLLQDQQVPNVTQMVINYQSRGQSGLASDVPPQIKAARGLDMVQGFQTPMEYGFADAHVQERFPMPGVPGNYLWMRPGARPLIVQTPNAGSAELGTGQDSIFQGQVPADTFTVQGGVLQNPPNAYTESPEAYVAPVLSPTASSWGWSEW